MIVAIFNAIAAVPALIKALESLISWISIQIDEAKQRQLAKQMSQATDQAKATKDTSGIDQLFGK